MRTLTLCLVLPASLLYGATLGALAGRYPAVVLAGVFVGSAGALWMLRRDGLARRWW